MPDLLKKPTIETSVDSLSQSRTKSFGRAVMKALKLREPLPSLKTADRNKDIGKHSLEIGKDNLTVDKLLARNALDKTFSTNLGEFRFSRDESGKVEGTPLKPEELNNRMPMSTPDDLVIFPKHIPNPRKSRE